MATRVVHLEHGFNNGDIQIPNRGRTWADKGDRVLWQIMPHSGISKIVDIQKKSKSRNIFEVGHPYRDGKQWKGDIRTDVPDLAKFRYSIFWQNDKGQDRECDPIISIRPSTDIYKDTGVVIAATVALISLVALLYFQRKRAKQQAREDLQRR